MPPEDENESLLARLNALKPSSITSLDPTKPHHSLSPTSNTQISDEDLTARFKKLAVARGPLHENAAVQDPRSDLAVCLDSREDADGDGTLEDLLRELDANDEGWKLDGSEASLLEEARATIAACHESRDYAAHEREHGIIRANPTAGPSTSHRDDAAHSRHPSQSSEQNEADEYAHYVLAEFGANTHSPSNGPSTAPSPPTNQPSPTTIHLPSPPTSPPLLPSTPTAQPLKPAPAEPEPEPDTDAWCIICLSDASLKCLGCDGDLYCSRCWEEGHTGEDAGWEERRHRAVRFVAKKKKRKKRLAV